MHMLNLNDLAISQEQYKDLIRAQNQRRLARQAMAQQKHSMANHQRLLDWLGRCMIAWGWRLRARYGYIQ
jgi:hypothetical protein